MATILAETSLTQKKRSYLLLYIYILHYTLGCNLGTTWYQLVPTTKYRLV